MSAIDLLSFAALAAATITSPQATGAHPAARPTVVLVHGGFVDGSGWQRVYRELKKDGYPVIIVQNPTTSLADDVAVTRRAIAKARSEVILVGHSYGGAVVSEAGNDPKVSRLVYITAFAPDAGESVVTSRRLTEAMAWHDRLGRSVRKSPKRGPICTTAAYLRRLGSHDELTEQRFGRARALRTEHVSTFCDPGPGGFTSLCSRPLLDG